MNAVLQIINNNFINMHYVFFIEALGIVRLITFACIADSARGGWFFLVNEILHKACKETCKHIRFLNLL